MLNRSRSISLLMLRSSISVFSLSPINWRKCPTRSKSFPKATNGKKVGTSSEHLPSSRSACLKALKEIGSEVPPGVYLPSNPEAIVISIRAGSGAPMQRSVVLLFDFSPSFNLLIFSAAKAPYRATFGVQTVGIDQVERCADPDYEFMQDFSHQYYQMAIFKVGDDVRQVGIIGSLRRRGEKQSQSF